jgi:membrane protein required for colicin V production
VIWVAAIYLAWTHYHSVSDQLRPWISTPSVRIGAGFLIIVLAVLIGGAIIGYVLSVLVEKTGLTGTDRLLGAVFGAGRGAILVAMLVFLAALTPFQQDPWWKQSVLVGRFQVLAEQVLGQIPSETVNKLKNLEAFPRS